MTKLTKAELEFILREEQDRAKKLTGELEESREELEGLHDEFDVLCEHVRVIKELAISESRRLDQAASSSFDMHDAARHALWKVRDRAARALGETS